MAHQMNWEALRAALQQSCNSEDLLYEEIGNQGLHVATNPFCSRTLYEEWLEAGEHERGVSPENW
jgi:hypothetical protein